MSYTGKFGIHDSQLGNILYGGDSAPQITCTANNTITFTQAASALVVSSVKIVNQTITFTQSANYLHTGITAVVNTLTFTQSARGFAGRKSVGQSLTLSQAVTAQKLYSRQFTDTLTFYQSCSAAKIHPASSAITFTQSVDVLSYKGANTTFGMTQTVGVNFTHNAFVQNTATFTQAVVVTAVRPISVSNVLTLTELPVSQRVRNLVASNDLVLRNFSTNAKVFNLTNTLAISQSAVNYKVIMKAVQSNLSLTQSVVKRSTFNLTASNQFKILEGYFKDVELNDREDDLTIYIPPVTVTKPIKLVVFKVPGKAISLRPPLLGDSEGLLDTLIRQRTIEGSVYNYVRTTESRKIKYKFEVQKLKAFEFRNFIYAYLSTPMQMENWKGEIWYGYIVNNPFSVNGKERAGEAQGGETYAFDVEFEGVRLH